MMAISEKIPKGIPRPLKDLRDLKAAIEELTKYAVMQVHHQEQHYV
ncbi:unnamed protein product [marine sediment metagenome]|uniref:Uncharacterized protein n=1 Tax=marine sediment metagenome TaxID=412755 RepID=X1BL82_9ZZZZ